MSEIVNRAELFAAAINRFPSEEEKLLKNARLSYLIQRRKNAQLKAKMYGGGEIKITDLHKAAYLLEPGVTHMLNWVKKKTCNELSAGGYVNFISFDRVPMGDWDWPDDIHAESCVTIKNLGDVYQVLDEFTSKHSWSRWHLYITPGGVRGYEVGRQMTPQKWNDNHYFADLNVDPHYAKFCLDTNRGVHSDYKDIYPSQSFNARVSGKPGRKDDFVAYPLGIIGSGTPNADSLRLIRTYHDEPIVQWKKSQGMNPNTVPNSQMDLVQRQLITIPSKYRESIEQRLNKYQVV